MALKVTLFFVVCVSFAACNSAEKASSEENIAGVYVREFSHEIINTNSGDKVGLRRVRDTILVEHTDDGYLISNRKWKLNDYDQEGWVSMKHAEDRPLPTFEASFDATSNSLIADDQLLSYPLFVDSERKRLYKGKDKNVAYTKVQ